MCSIILFFIISSPKSRSIVIYNIEYQNAIFLKMKQLFYDCKMCILHGRLRSPLIQDILLITNLHNFTYLIPIIAYRQWRRKVFRGHWANSFRSRNFRPFTLNSWHHLHDYILRIGKQCESFTLINISQLIR